MIHKSLAFISLIPILSFAAIEGPDKINVFEMKRKIQDQNKMILEMNREMNQVDISLGMQNKKYLKLADERAKIEDLLSRAKKNADLDSEGLKKSYNETKTILMGVLLNKLEKSEGPSDLLSRKILIENLQRRLVDLEGLMKSNKGVQEDVDKIYSRLEESMKTEKALVSIMNELEQKRKNLRANIEAETQKKTQAQNQFDDTKNKAAMDRDADRREKLREKLQPVQITEEIKVPSQPTTQAAAQMTSVASTSTSGTDALSVLPQYHAPVQVYQGMDYNKKGVTFNFQGKNEVIAPRAGKVVYTGSLASYGNVLMIDHGNDTRTVLLGQFDYTVKNGDTIQASQIVGYTNPRSTNGLGDGKIYFEVRKNNLAQNTYLLLDKKSLTH
jgi:murein DD-endopeptidase MepM/ murein hydrolase activator NlpD